MKRKGTSCLFFLVVCAIVWSRPPSAIAGRDHLKVALEANVQTMDFYQTSSRVALNAAYMIWDPLLERNPVTGELEPHLVTSWEVISPTIWEFKLRPGVRFHSGNPLTAESIRYTIEERILDPGQNSPIAAKWDWLKEVQVVDERTFRFIAHKPYPLVLQQLNTFFPYDPRWTRKMAAEHGDAYLRNHAVGTGPFKLVAFKPEKGMELERNDAYFQTGVPAFPRMTIKFLGDQASRVANLMTGGVDCADITPDQIPEIRKSDRLKVMETPILRLYFWQFDSAGRGPDTSPAVTDVRVRRAIWHAIDRVAIIEHVLAGHAGPVDIPLTLHFAADHTIEGYAYDRDKAKALLKEAGYENGFDLRLWTYTEPGNQVNEAASWYLAQVGIRAKIEDFIGRYGELAKLCREGKTGDVYTGGWGSYNIFDPDAILTYFFLMPDGPFNYTRDKTLSNWLRAARETVDMEKRKELYQKAQRRIVEQVYWMPFYQQHAILGVNKHFDFSFGVDEVPRWQYGRWTD